MPIAPIRSVGTTGIIKDTSPVLLPDNGWSDGRNVRFHNGSVEKIRGHESVLNLSAEPDVLLFWNRPTTQFWVYGDAQNLFRVDASGSEASIVPSGTTFSADGVWHASVFNGGYTVVMNNTEDTPVYMQYGTAGNAQETMLTNLPDWPEDTKAGVLRPLGYALVAGNLVDESGSNDLFLPGSILISNQAAPGGIPTSWTVGEANLTTADEFELSQTSPIREIIDLRGQGLVFTEDSIHSISLATSPTTPTTVRDLNYNYGVLATGCAIILDNRVLAVDKNDIYITSGTGTIQSVVDNKNREYFFNNLHPTNYATTFIINNVPLDEAWICYPTKGNSENYCDEALIWNYRDNTWTIRDLQNTKCAWLGPIAEDDEFDFSTHFLHFNGYASLAADGQQRATFSGNASNATIPATSAAFTWGLSGDANTVSSGVAEVQSIPMSGGLGEDVPGVADVQSFTLAGRSNVVVPATAEVIEVGVQDTLDYTNPLGTYFPSPGSTTHESGDNRSWPTGVVTPTNTNWTYIVGKGSGNTKVDGGLTNNSGSTVDFTNGRVDIGITVTALPPSGFITLSFIISNGLQPLFFVQLPITSIGTYTLSDIIAQTNDGQQMVTDGTTLDFYMSGQTEVNRNFTYTIDSFSLSTNQTIINSTGLQPFPTFSISNTGENISTITGTFAEPTGTQTDAEAAVASIRTALEADTDFTNDFTFTSLVDLPNAKAARYTANTVGMYEDFTYTVTANGAQEAGAILTVSTEGAETEGISSMYTITDGSAAESTSFSSSVALASSNDRASILSSIETAVDTNTETPINYTAEVSGDVVTLTAASAGVSIGDWTLAINNQGQTGDGAGTLVSTHSNVTPGVDTTYLTETLTFVDPEFSTIYTFTVGGQSALTAAEVRTAFVSSFPDNTPPSWTVSADQTNGNLVFTRNFVGVFPTLWTVSTPVNITVGTPVVSTAGTNPVVATTMNMVSSDNVVIFDITLASGADTDTIGAFIANTTAIGVSMTYDTATNVLTVTNLAAGVDTRPVVTIVNDDGTFAMDPTGSNSSGSELVAIPTTYTILFPTGFLPTSLDVDVIDSNRSQTLTVIRNAINNSTFTPGSITASVEGSNLIIIWEGLSTEELFSVTVDNNGGDGDITVGTAANETPETAESAFLMAADRTNTFNGFAFVSYIERKNLDMGDLEAVKWVSDVYPLMTGTGSVTIRFDGTDAAGALIDFNTTEKYLFNIAEDYQVSKRSNGRFFNVRFESDDSSFWKLDGYSVNAELSDRR